MMATWVAGTARLVVAFIAAPTTPPAPLTAEYLERLHAAWAWYALGYGSLFVTDCCIAVMGAVLAACLTARPGFGLPALTILFALSGVLGTLADVRMLGAAQLFRNGSALLTLEQAAGFLDELNAATNWLSAASFLAAGPGAWLVAGAARASGYGDGFVVFTRCVSLYQFGTGLLAVAAFLTQYPVLLMLMVAAALLGLPVITAAWLAWLLRELKGRIHAPAGQGVLA